MENKYINHLNYESFLIIKREVKQYINKYYRSVDLEEDIANAMSGRVSDLKYNVLDYRAMITELEHYQ